MPKKLDSYHKHEALDRCHVVCSMIDDFLVNHPYVEQEPIIKAKIKLALKYLSEAYQMIGADK